MSASAERVAAISLITAGVTANGRGLAGREDGIIGPEAEASLQSDPTLLTHGERPAHGVRWNVPVPPYPAFL